MIRDCWWVVMGANEYGPFVVYNRFLGNMHQAIELHREVSDRFPGESYRVAYIIANYSGDDEQ